MKKCTKCHIEKASSEFWKCPAGKMGLTPSCKACIRAYAAKWREANPDKVKAKIEAKKIASRAEPRRVKRDRQLRHTYGLSIDEWEKMLKAQGGKCGICERHHRKLSRVLQVDHAHKNGRIRGLLCTKCNTKLAAIEENDFVKKANSYLIKYSLELAE